MDLRLHIKNFSLSSIQGCLLFLGLIVLSGASLSIAVCMLSVRLETAVSILKSVALKSLQSDRDNTSLMASGVMLFNLL